MSIISAFGDDDHTAADGPYVRVLKVRKWLYVLATCAVLLGLRLYDPTAAKSLIRVLEFPPWLLVQATIVGSIYLLVQYGLLCAQLYFTYDIILDERLTFRRAEELARASDKIDQARSAIEAHRVSLIERARIRHKNAQAEMSVAQQHVASTALLDTDDPDWAHLDPAVRYEVEEAALRRSANAQQRLVEAMRNLEDALEELQQRSGSGDWIAGDPQGEALKQQMEEAMNEFDRLRRKDPAERPGYKHFEIAVDLQRIILPPLTNLAALLTLQRLVL